MEERYEFHPTDVIGAAEPESPLEAKNCPGLRRFCPHYASGVCDVKYSECVLLNSLKTAETLLRAEREKLLKNPTAQNLTFIAQINDVLRDRNPDMHVDAAAIIWNRRKGRFVAALLFAAICAIALLLSVGTV